jgi:D-amino-acid dehydrogenase
MRIVIIGSGLIGITTAYLLGCRGHEITVLDREKGPGLGASFANGGLLTPSMAEPWNAPGSWRVLLASLCRSDAAMRLSLRAIPSLAGWGVTFLRNSRASTFERNALSNLRLARYSLETMHSLRAEIPVDYGRAARGTLRIFRTSEALKHARDRATRLVAHGLQLRELTRAEAVELEPALEPIATEVLGAIHYECDEAGDAYRFCVELTEHARRLGVEFRFGLEVDALERTSRQVMTVGSRGHRFGADRFIIAAGSYSAHLVQRLGIRLPVRPVKGYSITLDTAQGPHSLRIPVIDDDFHAVVTPIGSAVRVAGTAEFSGYDLRANPGRICNLMGLLRKVLPEAQFDPKAAKPWSGLRSMSADGVPLIGSTSVENVMINTGHGHLGWTMAAGSARLLTDLICGESPSIDPAPYDPNRFAVTS